MNRQGPEAALRDLQAAVRRGRDMLNGLASARVSARDDDGTVVATADGLGRIVDLELSDEALRYPRLLGDRVTAAVGRVKGVASAEGDRWRQAYFPGSPSLAEIQASMSPAPERARARTELEEHRLYQEIGVGAGAVVMNAAATRLRVEIRPEAVRRVGAVWLADQIVEALRAAEERAEEFRFSALDRISVGDTAIGALMRAARRRLGIAEQPREDKRP